MTRITYTLLITAALITPAHADCTTRPMDDHGGVVHVCAEVVDIVDTSRPTVNPDDLADMMAVAMLDEDHTVIVVREK